MLLNYITVPGCKKSRFSRKRILKVVFLKRQKLYFRTRVQNRKRIDCESNMTWRTKKSLIIEKSTQFV